METTGRQRDNRETARQRETVESGTVPDRAREAPIRRDDRRTTRTTLLSFSSLTPPVFGSSVVLSFFRLSFFFFFFPSRLCKDGRVSNEAKTWALAWHRGPFAAFPLQAGAERRARDA